MTRSPLLRTLGLLAVLALTPRQGVASEYNPDDPSMSIPVADGRGKALPWEDFRLVHATARNQFIPKPSRDREKLEERITRRKAVTNPSPEEVAALASDLLRAGRPDEALELVKPLTSGARPPYFLLAARAQAHALRGEWADAVEYQSFLTDLEMPAQVKGLTPEQREWQAKLDATYVLRYFQVRMAEANARPRPAPEDEDVLPLFPLPERRKPQTPVRFVDAQGKYTPGDLAPDERAKLPPDAVAIVQQLLLWFPEDVRLYWLLGELYAADGKVETADTILDQCSWGRQYAPKLLKAHRAVLQPLAEASREARKEAEAEAKAATEAKAAEERREVAAAAETGRNVVWLFVGLVGLVVVLAVARLLIRRGGGPGCGPIG